MTKTEIALAVEADQIREICKAKKEKKIKEKYEAELAAFRAASSFPHLGPISLSLLGKVSGLSKCQLPLADFSLSQPIYVVSSDSNSIVKDISFNVIAKLLSLILRQSRHTQKPTRKLESQKRREIEDQSKSKRLKVGKSKINITLQLKEYLGSDIELYI